MLSCRIYLAGALALAACGGASKSTSPQAPANPPIQHAPVASPVPTPATPPEDITALPKAPEPPIQIPQGRLYDGYIVGGLPSKAQFEVAVEKGFEAAMSLMANDEEGIREIAPFATSLGVRYIRFTIQGKEDLNEAMAWQFASTLAMLGKPAIIHSARGERVGAIFALMAFFVDDASAEEAMAIGAAVGIGSLEEFVRAQLVH